MFTTVYASEMCHRVSNFFLWWRTWKRVVKNVREGEKWTGRRKGSWMQTHLVKCYKVNAASKCHRDCLCSNTETRTTARKIQNWLTLERINRKCPGLFSLWNQPVCQLIKENESFVDYESEKNGTHVCHLHKQPFSLNLDLGRKTI